MYICLDCKNKFYDPERFVEMHGFDSPPYEEWNGCPACGGAFVEAFCCDECGDWIEGEYVKLKDGSVFCSDCYVIEEL